MSRDWFAVYTRVLRLPKFGRLPADGQLALFYVWALAGDEIPEATWDSIGALEELLEFHGRNPGAVPLLISEGWLDVDSDGRVGIHDWDQWQHAATVSARRAWEAAYMRKWRRENKTKVEPSLPTPSLPKEQNNTGQDRIEPPTHRQRVNNVHAATEKNTCPGCGDLLDERDANVWVVDRVGRLGHRRCPDLADHLPEPFALDIDALSGLDS